MDLRDLGGGRLGDGAAADVAIVGFGFAGLMTLANLVRDGGVRRIVVLAPDASGLGLAYATTDTAHLLNVPAERMGAWAHAPQDFADWLGTPAAARACAELAVAIPSRGDFAPRALYGRYLIAVSKAVLAQARRRGMTVRFVTGTATGLARERGTWVLRAGAARVRARRCVLAVGHEPRAVLAGDLRAAADGTGAADGRASGAAGAAGSGPAGGGVAGVHVGPWTLPRDCSGLGAGPAVLVGTGLTAVDTLLSLRGAGFAGEIVAVSRHGLLPRAHRPGLSPVALDPGAVSGLDCPEAVVALIRGAVTAGHDWRAAVDGLRPHTAAVWQRMCAATQREAMARWGATWSVHRHRMAPVVAARVHAEREAGTLRILAGRVTAAAPHLVVAGRDGATRSLRPCAVVDCSGAHLDWATSRRPLLRGLIADHACVPHHTRMGVVADAEGRIGHDLFAVGSALTGQRWESTAVPELRAQAAAVAAALAPAAHAVAA